MSKKRDELYASIYLHVKQHDSTVRRLRTERVLLEDRQLGDGIADTPLGPPGGRQTSGRECEFAHRTRRAAYACRADLDDLKSTTAEGGHWRGTGPGSWFWRLPYDQSGEAAKHDGAKQVGELKLGN